MDLNMPISNGYEASQKITALFNQNKTVNFIAEATKSAKIDLFNIRPIIIACTSENLNHPHIADKISQADFDLTFMTPIHKEQILSELMPFIELRNSNLNSQVEISHQYEEYHQSILLQNNDDHSPRSFFCFRSQSSYRLLLSEPKSEDRKIFESKPSSALEMLVKQGNVLRTYKSNKQQKQEKLLNVPFRRK